MPEGKHTRREFFRAISFRARVILLVGIFTTFAGLGGLMVFTGFIPLRPLWLALLMASHSGACAILWALSFMWSRRLIPAAVVFSAGVPTAGMWYAFDHGLVEATSPISAAALTIVVFSALSVIAGYVCFVLFVQAEVTQKIRMRAELDMAQAIHTSLVPPIEVRTARFEVYAVSEASSEMGGDLIDMVEEDGRLDLYLADVSGHGVRAGVVMGMLKASIRTRLLAARDGENAVHLDTLLTDLSRMLRGVVEPGMFATAAFLRLPTTDGGEGAYAIAGHPPILHFRARSGDVARLENDRLPLGVLDEEVYLRERIDPAPGDAIAVFTDGLTETKNAAGRMIGLDGVERMFLSHAGKPARACAEAVLAEVRGAGAQDDDRTILVVKWL